MPKPAITKENQEEFIDMWNSNSSLSEIRNRFNCSGYVVRYNVNKLRLDPRSPKAASTSLSIYEDPPCMGAEIRPPLEVEARIAAMGFDFRGR